MSENTIPGYDAEEFDIHVRINKRWKDDFLSFLDNLQRLSEYGSSRMVGFFGDGDGDFKIEFSGMPSYKPKQAIAGEDTPLDYFYDAG